MSSTVANLSSRSLCAAANANLPAYVKTETERLHEAVLSPMNARLLGPLERRPFTEGVPLPVVLLPIPFVVLLLVQRRALLVKLLPFCVLPLSLLERHHHLWE